jgi:anti-sigma B factor antagonist
MNDRANGHRRGQEHDGFASTLVVTRTDTVDGVHLTAAGEIDLDSAPILTAALHHAIHDGDGPIVIDLGDVTFIDSSGVNALVTALQSARARLRLRTLHPAVKRVLEFTALLDLFTRADDLTSPY